MPLWIASMVGSQLCSNDVCIDLVDVNLCGFGMLLISHFLPSATLQKGGHLLHDSVWGEGGAEGGFDRLRTLSMSCLP